MKLGMVLEGGGMRGMYTAAVLDSLLDTNIKIDVLQSNFFTVNVDKLWAYNTPATPARAAEIENAINFEEHDLDLGQIMIDLAKDKTKDKTKTKENLIFPRYHQLDVIRKILADLKINSFHPCEPCVFSEKATGLLGGVSEGEFKEKADLLIYKLGLFKNKDCSALPEDSLLREFMG